MNSNEQPERVIAMKDERPGAPDAMIETETQSSRSLKRVVGRPRRIQLSRKKGWKLPPNTVVVSRPSKWGNPWVVGKDGTAAECVENYERRIANNRWSFPTKWDVRRELVGKHLACWCALDAPCHADVLLRLANNAAHRQPPGE